jgi:hypothetical protein
MVAGQVMGMCTLEAPTGPITHEWARIWLLPAIGATVVLVVFLIFFREPRPGVPAPVPGPDRGDNAELP